MIFQGEFSNSNGYDFKVVITNPNVIGDNKELKFTDNPLTINLEGEIFKPIRCTSATIRILTVGFDYMNLYSPKADVDVKVYRKSKTTSVYSTIFWQGILTPCQYDMGLDYNTEEVELEAIDYIAALEYYKYGQDDSSKLYNPTNTSLYSILKDILTTYTPYMGLYYPECFRTSNDTIIQLDELTLNTHTFFKDDAIKGNKVDLGECWTLKEVVEEICNYLNVSLTPSNGSSLILAMEYQSRERTLYTLYNFSNNNKSTGRGITRDETIDKYYTSSSISLTESWNSATVKIDKQEVKELYPDLFSDDALINACTSNHYWGDKFTYYIDDLDDKSDAYSTDKKNWKRFGQSYTKSNNGYDFVGNYKFFTNKNYNMFAYNSSGNSITYPEVINFDTLYNTMGAFFCKCSIEQFNSDGVGDYDDTSVASLNNQLIITNTIGSIFSPSFKFPTYPTTNKLLMQTKVGISPKIFLNADCNYLSIQGSMLVPSGWRYYNDQSVGTRGIANKDAFIKCKLKWGNYYFTNMDSSGNFQRQGRWTTTNSFFKLQFKANDGKTGSKFDIVKTGGDEAFKQWEISENGYIIQLDSKLDFTQSPIFEIYSKSTADKFNDNSNLMGIIIDKLDFKIGTYQPITMTNEEFESDTEYTNVIDEAYTTEGRELEVKINSYDNKLPSYTTVFYNGNYLGEIKQQFETSQNPINMEEWKVYHYVNEYKQPRKVLTLTVSGVPYYQSLYTLPRLFNEDFIMESYEYDVKNNRTTLNLKEVWSS